jgi:hypothetical protein
MFISLGAILHQKNTRVGGCPMSRSLWWSSFRPLNIDFPIKQDSRVLQLRKTQFNGTTIAQFTSLACVLFWLLCCSAVRFLKHTEL